MPPLDAPLCFATIRMTTARQVQATYLRICYIPRQDNGVLVF